MQPVRPECPYWSDGNHLYETIVTFTTNWTYNINVHKHYDEDMLGNRRPAKVCACGKSVAAVKEIP